MEEMMTSRKTKLYQQKVCVSCFFRTLHSFSERMRAINKKGEMLEWLKRHAWKACIRQKRIAGSNPAFSASIR